MDDAKKNLRKKELEEKRKRLEEYREKTKQVRANPSLLLVLVHFCHILIIK